jgi:drug/metabolite transporter (DMT)-like permease
MRLMQVTGAILIAAGLFMIIRPPSYSREESVFKLGDIEAKMQQKHTVPAWVGGVALGAGLVLVVVGLKRRF